MGFVARNYKQVPDEENPLIAEMNDAWGQPVYLTRDHRNTLLKALYKRERYDKDAAVCCPTP